MCSGNLKALLMKDKTTKIYHQQSPDQLSDLVSMDSTEAVLEEVLNILHLIDPALNIERVLPAFHMTVLLYKGNYEGYRACNTGFHDLRHATDTFLAMARLLHGAVLAGNSLTADEVTLGLITALLHDTGYIQEGHDKAGTGAKYTAIHVPRSMDFLKRHSSMYQLSESEAAAGQKIILCTDLSVDVDAISFPSPKTELLGKMLGTADLLAQMADRNYLEKILLLYYEFREARVGDYKDELDLLKKTAGFYEFIAVRLKDALDDTTRFMPAHFVSRWSIQADLYQEAIYRQKQYLLQLLSRPLPDLLVHLRRGNIVDRIRKLYQDNI